jgi:hypothetical protein
MIFGAHGIMPCFAALVINPKVEIHPPAGAERRCIQRPTLSVCSSCSDEPGNVRALGSLFATFFASRFERNHQFRDQKQEADRHHACGKHRGPQEAKVGVPI